ncbi:MAG: hypothetical protein Q8Q85_00015 [Gemmatimonadales bacterium]|nr:hypothetical protein [Gemmatimonadales bacterium]
MMTALGWAVSAGVHQQRDALDMASWAFSLGSQEAKAAGKSQLAMEYGLRVKRVYTMYAKLTIPQIFKATADYLAAGAPQMAARVRKMAYDYAVKYEGWQQKVATGAKAMTSALVPVLPASMVPSADPTALTGGEEPFYKQGWFLPAAVLGGVVVLGAILLLGSKKK